MKTHEAVKVLMRLMDDNQPKQKAIIWDAFVKMFDLMIEEYEALRPKPAEPIKVLEPAPDKPKKKRAAFDVGKMRALLTAGWSVPKIADEMGVSAPTVRKYMREEGYKC